MPSLLVGPCPIARVTSSLCLAGLASLPIVRESDGSALRGGAMLFRGEFHPTIAMLVVGAATAAFASLSKCPRQAWRAAFVGSAGLLGMILFGVASDAAAGAPAFGLYFATAALAVATLTGARRCLFVAPEPAPDPRDEVGDPRIDGSPGPESDPDEIREIAEMSGRSIAH